MVTYVLIVFKLLIIILYFILVFTMQTHRIIYCQLTVVCFLGVWPHSVSISMTAAAAMIDQFLSSLGTHIA
jgi:hypothetical protein